MLATQLRRVAAPTQAFRPAAVARAPVARRLVVKPVAAAEEAAVIEAPVEAGPKAGVARLSFQRGSVHKVRRVLDTIRGRSFEDALILMEYMPYRACERIVKALVSAAANAKHNQGAVKSKLRVTECYADQGPYLKRVRTRAQGRANLIMKPTFHLTIKVEETA